MPSLPHDRARAGSQIATEESKRLTALALFKNGTVVSQTVGARPKAAILREIEPYLGAIRI